MISTIYDFLFLTAVTSTSGCVYSYYTAQLSPLQWGTALLSARISRCLCCILGHEAVQTAHDNACGGASCTWIHPFTPFQASYEQRRTVHPTFQSLKNITFIFYGTHFKG